MKRSMSILILVTLVMALLPTVALAQSCTDYPLYAGKTTLVGSVTVCNDENSLTVTYNTSFGWSISETHLAVGDELRDIPQTKTGNPIPGQFPYGGNHNPPVSSVPFTIAKSAIGPNIGHNSTVIIAAHAVVWNPASQMTLVVCSDTMNETFVAYNNPILGSDTGAVDGRTGVSTLAWEPYGVQDGSVWDEGVAGSYAFDPGCDWIWENTVLDDDGYARSVSPINGDIVDFTETFVVPGPPAPGSTLRSTTDNGHEAYINGTFLHAGEAQNNWRASDLSETTGLLPFINTNGWQSVEGAPGNLDGMLNWGANTLLFQTANEYYNPPDLGNLEPGTRFNNPAGLIYEARINYYNDDETAWAAQGQPGTIQFPGKNWATYITYTWYWPPPMTGKP